MNFAEAEAYLLSLGNEVTAMKLGLESMRTLIRSLGTPAADIPKVQVAGTNGKGSVCAFLDSICRAAGIRVGLYTSPHLVSVTERIRIDGEHISEPDFAKAASLVRSEAEHLVESGQLPVVPTFFEQVTAIALTAFAEQDVDLITLETGLGGKLDATTAAEAEFAAITRIDLDHQEYLGETLTEIAMEKASIIHKGSRVVIGPQQPEAMEVIVGRCRMLGVDPQMADEVELPTANLGLAGRHQMENAKIAVATARELSGRFAVDDAAIAKGLEGARHPGRLEYEGDFLFDGAHNVGGARALAAYIDEFEPRPLTIVFGCMQDKDVRQIAEIIFPKAEHLIVTRPANSRAMASAELRAVAGDMGIDALATVDAGAAIDAARAVSSPRGIILITGSLYLVGEVKRLLNN